MDNAALTAVVAVCISLASLVSGWIYGYVRGRKADADRLAALEARVTVQEARESTCVIHRAATAAVERTVADHTAMIAALTARQDNHSAALSRIESKLDRLIEATR